MLVEEDEEDMGGDQGMAAAAGSPKRISAQPQEVAREEPQEQLQAVATTEDAGGESDSKVRLSSDSQQLLCMGIHIFSWTRPPMVDSLKSDHILSLEFHGGGSSRGSGSL